MEDRLMQYYYRELILYKDYFFVWLNQLFVIVFIRKVKAIILLGDKWRFWEFELMSDKERNRFMGVNIKEMAQLENSIFFLLKIRIKLIVSEQL